MKKFGKIMRMIAKLYMVWDVILLAYIGATNIFDIQVKRCMNEQPYCGPLTLAITAIEQANERLIRWIKWVSNAD